MSKMRLRGMVNITLQACKWIFPQRLWLFPHCPLVVQYIPIPDPSGTTPPVGPAGRPAEDSALVIADVSTYSNSKKDYTTLKGVPHDSKRKYF